MGTGRILREGSILLALSALACAEADKTDWIARLKDPEPAVRYFTTRYVEGPAAVAPLREMVNGGDPDLRLAAIRALGRIGADAADCVRDVAAHVQAKDYTLRFEALRTLARIGPTGLAEVERYIASADPNDANVVIGRLTDPTPEAVALLIRLAMSGPKGVQESAARILETVGHADPRDVLPLLDNPSQDVRFSALRIIDKVGWPSRAELLKALRNDNPIVRRTALFSLAKLAPGSPELVDATTRALGDPSVDVRRAGWDACGACGEAIVPVLSGALRDKDLQIREAATGALSKVGPEGKALLPQLVEALFDPARGATPESFIERVGKGDTATVEGVAKGLLLPEVEHRKTAARVLAALAPDVAPVVPALLQGLSDADASVRSWCLAALSKVSPPPEGLAPRLIALLADPIASARSDAAKVLASIGPPAVPLLVKALKEGNTETKEGAMCAIHQMKPPPPDAIPLLVEALVDRHAQVRSWAASALGDYGEKGAPGVTQLVDLLGDWNETVRRCAALSLASIGANAGEALLSYIRDGRKDPALRAEALKALAQASPGVSAEKACQEMLSDAEPVVRKTAEELIAVMRPPAGVPESPKDTGALLRLACDADWQVRKRAMAQLCTRPPDVMLPALVGALADPVAKVRIGAADALREWVDAQASLTVDLASRKAPPDRVELKALVDHLASARSELNSLAPAIGKALADPDVSVKMGVAYALREMGPLARGAVPSIIEALSKRDEQARGELTMALVAAQPRDADAIPWLIEGLKAQMNQGYDNRLHSDLRAYGPAAASAIPSLASGLSDDYEGYQVSKTLAAIGEDALPALVAALQDPRRRGSAGRALSAMHRHAAKAVPDLIRALKADDADLRRVAAGTLGDVAEGEESATAALREALHDANNHVRQEATIALLHLVPEDAEARESFTRLTAAIKESQRINFTYRVEREVDLSAEVAVLRDMLASKDASVRITALRSIGDRARKAPETLPLVRAAFADADEDVRCEAACQLAGRSESAAELLPYLCYSLVRDEGRHAEDALWALDRMGPGAAPAIPFVLEVHPPSFLVARILGNAGRESEEAKRWLERMTSVQDANLRCCACEARMRLGEIDLKVIEACVGLRHYEMIEAAGRAAAEAIPELREMMSKDDSNRRGNIAAALAAVEGDATEALYALAPAVAFGSDEDKRSAVEALGRMGAPAADLVPLLEPIADSQDPQLREAAAKLIAQLMEKK